MKRILEKLNKLLELIEENAKKIMRRKSKAKTEIKNSKRKTIATRISITIAIIIAVVMGMTSMVIYSFINNGMISRNKESMEVISNEVYENFNSMMSIQTNQISDLAGDSSVITLLSSGLPKDEATQKLKEELNNKLKNSFSDAKNTEHMFITDNKGLVICDSHEEYINYDYSQNQCVILAKEGNLNMSTVHISPETGKAVVTMVAPVKDKEGKVIGTLGKDLYTGYFSQRFDNFKFLNTGFIYIVDSDDQVIYHPDKLKINKKNSIKQITEIIGKKESLNKKNTDTISYNEGKNSYMAYYTSVPALKSLVILSVDANELKQEANMAGQIILISAVIMIIIVVSLMYLVINRTLSPLKQLIKNTEEMARGNLKITSNIVDNNEFGQLSTSFNKMSENIKSVISNTKSVLVKLTEISDTIQASQEITETSMREIAGSSEVIGNDNVRMNEAVQDSSESFKKIVAKTQEMKTQSEKMIGKTNDIRTVNYKGLETIKKLEAVNTSAVDKISTVNTSFHELFDNLDAIKGITNLVTNISKQTHILSLNASIEAARAGEAGRGFSVVATQIKGLSQNISDQMNKIEEIVLKINSNIIVTKDNLDEVNRSADEEVAAVQETIDNYNLILNVTEEITAAINKINESINVLGYENHNVNEVIGKVSVLSNEFSESLDEINSVIKSQYDNTKAMAELVLKLEKATEDINRNMNEFTVG